MLYRLSSLAIFFFTLTAFAVPIQFTFSGPQGSVAINGGTNLDGVLIQLVLQGDTANLVRGGGNAGSDVYRGLTGTITVSGTGASISNVAVTSLVDVHIGFPTGIARLVLKGTPVFGGGAHEIGSHRKIGDDSPNEGGDSATHRLLALCEVVRSL